jgi:PadR family transcriptional regulator, regulatory protein AphA
MELTPTSYALLGLLAVRPWSTYELAHQTKRSLQYFFPRAERHLYAEAKRLADAGFASGEVTFTGKRRTTTYAITPAGRKALRAWLRTPPAPPVLETEVLVRAFFAENGRTQDLVASLETAREQAVATQQELATMAQAWFEGNAPFPERVAVGALAMRFVADFHHLMEDWATWAAAQVRTWEQPDGSDWAGAYSVFDAVRERRSTVPNVSRPTD